MKIADREIGPGHPVYIIAEAGLAHLGSLDLAMEMLHAAKEAGADAFKTQFWDVRNSKSLYSGKREPNRCLTPYSLNTLARECAKLKVHFLCTPHDEYALEYVAEVCPAIKIGSGERRNWDFIKKAISYNLPLVISMGNYKETDRYQVIGTVGEASRAYLFCIPKYPTTWEDIKGQMPDFRNSQYDGWSSHTETNWLIDQSAVAAGAKIIEKHIKPCSVHVETSMDMKASTHMNSFHLWCREIRRVDELFP